MITAFHARVNIIINQYNMGKVRFLTGSGYVMIGLIASLILFSSTVFANGGDQRVVEGEYLINLARAPFTPRVEEKTSFLASFVDIEKNKLIAEDLFITIRIAKLGGTGSEKRTFLFEQENIMTKGGILDFSYTFADTGLHEVFFDFAFVSDPQRIYEAPDFLLDVQPQTEPEKSLSLATPLTVGIGFTITLIIGFMIGRRIAKL